MTNNSSTVSYVATVLPFIPGEMFDTIDKKYLEPSVLKSIGEKAALLDLELKVCITISV